MPDLYGGKGMGAQRAAWQSAYNAEAAVAAHSHFAQSLLDLVRVFEKVPHHMLVSAARRLGYDLRVLRLTLAAYRLPRTLGIDGVHSRLIHPVIGITAGAVSATIDLKVLLYESLVATKKAWPLVQISLYVDDANLESARRSRK